MRVLSFSRVADIPPALWDAAGPPDFYFQRAFLQVMEEARVERARYRYLALLDDEAVVGLAVLSAFTLRLDLLADDPWVRRLRRLAGGLLDVPIICCGIPASYGQHHLHLVRDELAGPAVRQVHRCMEEWAEEEECGMLFWKEWNPRQPVYRALLAEGYVPLPTLPDHRVRIVPADQHTGGVDGFLRTLRSAYRRKYRAAAALLRGPGPVWRAGALELEVGPFREVHAAEFHAGYRRVMERTPVRLELYPEAFFEALARRALDVRLVRLAHREHGESISALLVADHQVLTFALTSKEFARYRAALYSVLLQCIVLLGVRGGFREVRLGQTSSFAKGCVGAESWRLETLVRARGAWRHRLLERFGSRLFPEVESPSLHAYRDGGRIRPRAPSRHTLGTGS